MDRDREGSVSSGAWRKKLVRRGLENASFPTSLTRLGSLWQKLDAEWDAGRALTSREAEQRWDPRAGIARLGEAV